ncbi:uncharacterized protein LOC122624580 [Drosophila teissieri]|uniref:uncharacterized protein LOC122624580 n=1 Tax=Drosophila teissieri TaxID=7243 RepID=UPI001CBA3094|nr:uncharacterized protein LOC122624580 [Drosophila teissieri]
MLCSITNRSFQEMPIQRRWLRRLKSHQENVVHRQVIVYRYNSCLGTILQLMIIEATGWGEKVLAAAGPVSGFFRLSCPVCVQICCHCHCHCYCDCDCHFPSSLSICGPFGIKAKQ